MRAEKASSQPGGDMQNKEQDRLPGGSAAFLPLLTLGVVAPRQQGGNVYYSLRLERVGLVSVKDVDWVVMAGHEGGLWWE